VRLTTLIYFQLRAFQFKGKEVIESGQGEDIFRSEGFTLKGGVPHRGREVLVCGNLLEKKTSKNLKGEELGSY